MQTQPPALWVVDFKSHLMSLKVKYLIQWLLDVSQPLDHLDHKFRSCSGAVRLREYLAAMNSHRPPPTYKPCSTSAPLHLPPSTSHKEHTIGICSRKAVRHDPADFRCSQFLAKGGLFYKQAEEPRRFTWAPVTTRWFVFTRSLICLDSLLSKGFIP